MIDTSGRRMKLHRSSGKKLGKIACTKPCGSSDAMEEYEQDDGTINAFCFSCGHYDPDSRGTNKQSDKITFMESSMKGSMEGSMGSSTTGPLSSFNTRDKTENNYDKVMMSTILLLPTRDSPTRGLHQDTLQYFGVKTEISTIDGSTITSHFYPCYKDGILTGWKQRKMPKTFMTYGDTKGCEFFGQQQAKKSGSRKLFITEGEEDTMALYQALRSYAIGGKWEGLTPAVVSLPHGAASAVRDISNNMDFIKKFETVTLVFDTDERGKEAAVNVCKLLPTAQVAEIAGKDANEMVLSGEVAQLCKAVLFNAKKIRPASIVTVDDAYLRATSRPVMGMSWPWPTLTRSTYGIHRKKMYGLGAGVNIGKSDWAKELAAHITKEHKLTVGVFALEEDVGTTLKHIASKQDRVLYHLPDANYNQEALNKGIDNLKGKVLLFDHVGTRDWDEIKSGIRYMVAGEGVKDIILDPLTALHAHLPSSSANDELNKIMSELSSLVHELDFTCYYLCHLNPPESGPPHERGGKVLESQFTGSRAMMRFSQYLMGLERNKDPELPEDERNTSTLVLLKDRDYGRVVKFPIFYAKATGEFLEPKEQRF